MLQFSCPSCDKKFETDDGYAGGQVICDKCGFHFYVPEMEDIEQVIVEYVDEKSQKEKFSIGKFFSLKNKINIFYGSVILIFLLLAAGFIYLRNERIRQEQLRRAEILKLEHELQKENLNSVRRLMQDVYALKYRIDRMNPDRGQTFGKHLDILEEGYSEAVVLFNQKKFPECENVLEKTKMSAEWIIKNLPVREKVKKHLQDIAVLIKAKDNRITEEKISAAKKAYYYYSEGKVEQALAELEKEFSVNNQYQR